jgi:hypothetical protein
MLACWFGKFSRTSVGQVTGAAAFYPSAPGISLFRLQAAETGHVESRWRKDWKGGRSG